MKKPNIFKTKLFLPPEVELYKQSNRLLVKGPKGLLTLHKLYLVEGVAELATCCKLLHNSLVGVSAQYFILLKFVGIGYRVQEISESLLKLKLGFSHDIIIDYPVGISLFSPKKNILILVSSDLAKLRSFAYLVRSIKMPDCYKAKGILIKNEVVIMKEGKKQ